MTDNHQSRIVYLTAGAGGMFCGSCMHDNALAKSLTAAGWDVMLVPFYTPIRTDESNVSVDQVFFGGINVYLQQKVPLLRYLPRFVDRFLDSPWLIRRATAKSIETDAKMLGSLALSVLKGHEGNQRKEVKRVNKWLVNTAKPDLIVISNILVAGFVPTFKKKLDIPVLVTLQGDDIFLDQTPEPYRSKCIEQIKKIAVHVDGFIVHSQFFGDYMREYFDLDPDKLHVTPLGLETQDFENRFANRHEFNQTIGYLARLAPEKGLHNLVDAFIELKQNDQAKSVRLKIAGWLGKQNEEYAEEQFSKLKAAGLESEFEYIGEIDRAQKLDFLESVDVLSVPTDQKEPKGIFVLEALAAGVPVVQPDHGSFPEMIQATGGGVTYSAGDNSALATQLLRLALDQQLCQQMGRAGQQAVFERRSEKFMAQSTGDVFRRFLE